MENLALALYFAELISGLKTFFCVCIAIAGLTIIFNSVCKVMVFIDGYKEETEKYYPIFAKVYKYAIPTFVFGILFAIVVPSKTVMYSYIGLKAASDVKEAVITSPTFEKIDRLVNKKLDELLGEDKKNER